MSTERKRNANTFYPHEATQFNNSTTHRDYIEKNNLSKVKSQSNFKIKKKKKIVVKASKLPNGESTGNLKGNKNLFFIYDNL